MSVINSQCHVAALGRRPAGPHRWAGRRRIATLQTTSAPSDLFGSDLAEIPHCRSSKAKWRDSPPRAGILTPWS